MADRSTTRKKQKREKKRLKDKRRGDEARKKRRASLVKSPQKLIGLPLSDCFISEHWHEQGPTIDEVERLAYAMRDRQRAAAAGGGHD